MREAPHAWKFNLKDLRALQVASPVDSRNAYLEQLALVMTPERFC